jgi:hypothetical protein
MGMPEVLIRLTYSDKVFTYKTLKGARNRARGLIGPNPLGVEGAARRRLGEYGVLYFSGCTFTELFPPVCESCGMKGPVDYEENSDLHLCEKCWDKWVSSAVRWGQWRTF